MMLYLIAQFHQAKVAVAVQMLLKHVGPVGLVELPFGDFTVTIKANPKKVTQ